MHIWECKDWFGVFSLWTGEFLSTCLCKLSIQLFGANLNLAWASQALCMLFDLWLYTFRKTGSSSFHQSGMFWAPTVWYQCVLRPARLVLKFLLPHSSYSSFHSHHLKRHLCAFEENLSERRGSLEQCRGTSCLKANHLCWSHLPAHKLRGFFKVGHPASTLCWCGLTLSAMYSSTHITVRKALSH